MFLRRNEIKQLLNKGNKIFLSRYIIISAIGYSIIFFGLYLFVDILDINKTISFLIVYAINYMFLYMVQLKYLFKTKHNHRKLIRFIIYLATFYLLAICLFTIGTKIGLQYLLATATTIIILFPLRLLILKKVVYKD